MHALPEGDVTVRLPGDVQIIGADELPLVPVGRSEQGVDHLATRDRHAAERHILTRIALGCQMHRRVIAQAVSVMIVGGKFVQQPGFRMFSATKALIGSYNMGLGVGAVP